MKPHHFKNRFNLWVLFTSITTFSFAQPSNNFNLYYGLLHAHTLYSDGSGTPEEAYRAAKDAGLNFFAITEHNHNRAEQGADADRRDGVLIGNDHELYNGTSPVHFTRTTAGGTQNMTAKSLIKAAQDATTSSFLPLYGQEFSTISSGNHMNVFNINEVLEIPNGNFAQLYNKIETLGNNTILLQMNHPDVHADLFGSNADINDYGIDESVLGNNFASFVASTDKYIQLIEVLSGPAMQKTSSSNYHYPHVREDDYFFYLKQGFHIAPSAGQDNHYKTWGKSSNARIGVYATALNKESLTEAIRSYRTFVTEDKNTSVTLWVNNAIMGSMIQSANDQELILDIQVQNTNQPNMEYTIEIFGGSVDPKPYSSAIDFKVSDELIGDTVLMGNGVLKYKGLLSSGDAQFYYIKITDTDGDRTWTAPVWVNHPEVGMGSNDETIIMYYWTRSPSSTVFHVAGCSSINSIKPENLQSGTNPPQGRHQHSCNVTREEH